jgi:hypothetical protein
MPSGVFRILMFVRTVCSVLVDGMTFLCLRLRSSSALAAENLFRRKQLAMYVERKQKPRRATDSARFTLAQPTRFFDWRSALAVVKPDTLIRWHRRGFRLFWKWKSRPSGRPKIPVRTTRPSHRTAAGSHTSRSPTAKRKSTYKRFQRMKGNGKYLQLVVVFRRGHEPAMNCTSSAMITNFG